MVPPDAERGRFKDSKKMDITHRSQVEGILLWGWLGGYNYDGGEVKAGRLLTIEELGEFMKSRLIWREP